MQKLQARGNLTKALQTQQKSATQVSSILDSCQRYMQKRNTKTSDCTTTIVQSNEQEQIKSFRY